MRVRWLVAVCAFVVLCGTPLASARTLEGNLNLPGPIIQEADGPGGASVGYFVSDSDPNVTIVSCSPGSGTLFPINTTTVSCTGSDADGNVLDTGSFTVTVQDTLPPALNLPGTVNASSTTGSGVVVNYTQPTANDIVDGPITPTCSKDSGDTFPVGTTTVNCSASDTRGHTSSGSFNVTVTVVDTTPPVVGDVSDISDTTTSAGGKTIGYTKPSANDNLDGSLPVSCTKEPGSNFPVGHTTVTCSATDAHGNTGSSSFNVDITLVDTTAPVVGDVSDISDTTTSASGKTISYTKPSANDNVDGSVPVSCTKEPGSNFPVGHTTVTCSATDAHGNTGSSSFNVDITLVDTTPPVVGDVSDISATTTSASGKTISYTKPSANDNLDGSLPVSCTKEPGSNFPVGHTTVTCSATDAHGNTGSSSFNVDITLVDTTPPVVNAPADRPPVEATGAGGATVTFPAATATDNIDGAIAAPCLPASGSVFPVGLTTVICTATDAHSNTGSDSFTVTVNDTTPPAVHAPADMANIEATGSRGAPVAYGAVSANDLVDGVLAATCSPASGSTFPVGATTVTCQATDAHHNTGSDTFKITVKDSTAPTVTAPADRTAEATGLNGAAVSFPAATATDTVDGSLAAPCTPASGSTFALGQTTVTCTATDAHGNHGSGTFKVTVGDTTAPVLSGVPADKTVEANGFAGSIVDFVPPTAVDLGEPRLVSCTPARNSTFALGTTTVTCSASDGRGNTGTATFKVNVVDTTPPSLIPPGDFRAYAVDNSGTYAADDSVQKFVFGAHVSDIADPHPTLATDTPNFFPVGTTTVHFTATDASGNTTKAEAKLTILPKPAPGTTPPALPPPTDNTPPGPVTGLTGKGGDRRATLKWTNPKDSDFAAVEIERGTNAAFSSVKATGTVVYHGSGTSYVDKGLTNDVSYRYVVHSVDKLGNKSAGVPINITPHLQLLKTPPDGARLATIPKKFVWVRDPKAAYYNFQLFVGGSLLLQSTAAEPRKILSTWTTAPSLNFKNPWKWEGKSYKLAKGTYTWYVWPGYGARADVKYGPLMGSATFQITKTPKPAKKPAKPKKKKK